MALGALLVVYTVVGTFITFTSVKALPEEHEGLPDHRPVSPSAVRLQEYDNFSDVKWFELNPVDARDESASGSGLESMDERTPGNTKHPNNTSHPKDTMILNRAVDSSDIQDEELERVLTTSEEKESYDTWQIERILNFVEGMKPQNIATLDKDLVSCNWYSEHISTAEEQEWEEERGEEEQEQEEEYGNELELEEEPEYDSSFDLSTHHEDIETRNSVERQLENNSNDTDTILFCADDQWLCASRRQCVPLHWVCDGRDQCDDESDEDTAMCARWNCVSTMWKCADSFTCVFKTSMCNGWPNCEDASDEKDCPSLHCPANQSPCADNIQCVFISRLCDDVIDCYDGSDEEGCECDPMCASQCYKFGAGKCDLACKQGFILSPNHTCTVPGGPTDKSTADEHAYVVNLALILGLSLFAIALIIAIGVCCCYTEGCPCYIPFKYHKYSEAEPEVHDNATNGDDAAHNSTPD